MTWIWLYVAAVFFTPGGLALAAVGLVLRLCESAWGKPAGTMGSYVVLLVGGFLCVPALVVLQLALVEWLVHWP
jgi:hypothetical protein